MTRGIIAASGLVLLGALAGCSGSSQSVSMGAVSAEPATPTLSLGSGDSLGRAIYINDVILANGGIVPDDAAFAGAAASFDPLSLD